MTKWKILMQDGSQWEGEAEFSVDAVAKAEAETRKRAEYFLGLPAERGNPCSTCKNKHAKTGCTSLPLRNYACWKSMKEIE